MGASATSPCPQTPELKIRVGDGANQLNESILDVSENKVEKIFQISNDKKNADSELLIDPKNVLNANMEPKDKNLV